MFLNKPAAEFSLQFEKTDLNVTLLVKEPSFW